MRSFVNVNIMVVFAVKYRYGFLSRHWRQDLYAVMGNILKEMPGIMPLKIGGVNDHVHVLYSTRGLVADSEVVRKLKSESSLWINSNNLVMGKFAWQDGSSRFSYSYRELEMMKNYIERQEEHHSRMSFRDELAAFFRAMGYTPTKFDYPEEPK